MTAIVRPSGKYARPFLRELRIGVGSYTPNGEITIRLRGGNLLKVSLDFRKEDPCLKIFLNTTKWRLELYHCLECDRIGISRPCERVGLLDELFVKYHFLDQPSGLQDDDAEPGDSFELLLYPVLSNWRDLDKSIGPNTLMGMPLYMIKPFKEQSEKP